MAQITSKELMYLDDFLNMESQEITKYTQAANSATDPQVKSLLTSISNLHQTHFNTLSQHLSNSGSQSK